MPDFDWDGVGVLHPRHEGPDDGLGHEWWGQHFPYASHCQQESADCGEEAGRTSFGDLKMPVVGEVSGDDEQALRALQRCQWCDQRVMCWTRSLVGWEGRSLVQPPSQRRRGRDSCSSACWDQQEASGRLGILECERDCLRRERLGRDL